MSFLRNLFGESVRWDKDPKPRIMTWSATRQGRLLINGKDHTPIHPWKKAELEEKLRRFQEKIKDTPIVIEAIHIEPHVATGLWNEGTINTIHLANSNNTYNGITFPFELDGKGYTVSIQPSTYYTDYEFIVSGHPKGTRRMRDVPDALELLSGEE